MLHPAPRAGRHLLALLLPRALRDDVVANLDDLHAIHARRDGQWRADLWYWRQALALPIRLAIASDPPAVPRASATASFLRSVGQDVRYTLRLHRARPALALAALASLGAGIGLNTAVFSVIDRVLLRPAPVADLDRVMMVWETDRQSGTTREPASLPDFDDFRRRAATFSSLGTFMAGDVTLAPATGDPVRLTALYVSHDLWPIIGAAPLLGRVLSADDERAHAAPAALVSASLWRRAFNGAPDVVGTVARIDDQRVTVAGVVPDSADFGVLQILTAAAYARSFADRGTRRGVDLWLPAPDPASVPRATHPAFVLGRLAPGAGRPQAQQDLGGIAADLERTYPRDNAGRGVNVEPLADVVFGAVRPALLALEGAVALVLLVACANVANLLLVRGASRRREIAVRMATGAGRARLARQFLTEALVLSVVAGLIGVVLAYAALGWLVAAGPATIPQLSSATLDLRVLGVTLGISIAVGVAAGCLPVMQALGTRPVAALSADATRTSTAGRDGRRARAGLVMVELALATTLVIAAGLLLKSFWRLRAVDPGFQTAGVLKVEYELPPIRYPADMKAWPRFREMHAFTTALVDRAAAIPGVTAAGAAGNHPFDPGFTNSFAVVGREAEARTWPEIGVRRVTAGYFGVVGVPLRRGRVFAAGDRADAAPVAVVNDAAVRRFFADQDPLGHEIAMWGHRWRVVGVVGDERFQGLTTAAPPALYLPLLQAPSVDGSGVLLVKTAADPRALVRPVREAFRAIDPGLALFGVEPLDDTAARAISERRFTMTMIGAFAIMALGLAVVGVHGVLSYGVTERAREIGIRLALGARPDRLRRLVLRQALGLAVGGIAAGVAGALALTRLLRSLLYSVGPTDPATFGVVIGVLLLAAAAAAYLPARRATRIDPSIALRTGDA